MILNYLKVNLSLKLVYWGAEVKKKKILNAFALYNREKVYLPREMGRGMEVHLWEGDTSAARKTPGSE